MLAQVYPTPLRSLVLLQCVVLGLSLPLGCSSKKHHAAAVASTGKKDAASKDEDAGETIDLDAAPPFASRIDAAALLPGDPPAELAGELCAVDTNKLYALSTSSRAPEPTRLAVDLINSRFGVAYIDKSDKCLDAVFVSVLEGPSGLGMPTSSSAVDPCSTIQHSAIAHNGQAWLIASVDARQDQRDLWLQAYDGQNNFDPHRVTDNTNQKNEVELVAIGTDAVLAAWVETDSSGSASVNVRLTSPEGDPSAEPVVIDQMAGFNYAGLALGAFGTEYVGLGYRRFDMSGHAEIVLQVLDATTGKPVRDEWVLTKEAGAYGSFDISVDDGGGGVIYSVIEGTSEQLWFQGLDKDGTASKVQSAGRTGGASDPTRVVGPPYNAVDASLAKLVNGYIVAYRALPGGMLADTRIRIQFLDRFGRIIGNGNDSDVALAQKFGGRTAIVAGYDGRMVIGWSDQDDTTGKTTLTVVKLPCVGGI